MQVYACSPSYLLEGLKVGGPRELGGQGCNDLWSYPVYSILGDKVRPYLKKK